METPWPTCDERLVYPSFAASCQAKKVGDMRSLIRVEVIKQGYSDSPAHAKVFFVDFKELGQNTMAWKLLGK